MPDNEPYDNQCPYCRRPFGDDHTVTQWGELKVVGCPEAREHTILAVPGRWWGAASGSTAAPEPPQ